MISIERKLEIVELLGDYNPILMNYCVILYDKEEREYYESIIISDSLIDYVHRKYNEEEKLLKQLERDNKLKELGI